jgi:hypothetical protein
VILDQGILQPSGRLGCRATWRDHSSPDANRHAGASRCRRRRAGSSRRDHRPTGVTAKSSSPQDDVSALLLRWRSASWWCSRRSPRAGQESMITIENRADHRLTWPVARPDSGRAASGTATTRRTVSGEVVSSVCAVLGAIITGRLEDDGKSRPGCGSEPTAVELGPLVRGVISARDLPEAGEPRSDTR